MTISSKRAEYLARASLGLTGVFFVIALLTGLWSGFFAVFAVSWLMLAAILIWFALCLQFYQRSLAEQEKLDTAHAAGDKRTSTIFEQGDERITLFAVAQRRLRTLEKWFIPIFSAVIAIYELAIGLYLFGKISVGVDIESKQPHIAAVLMVAIAFVSFLVSRYATGMSAEMKWRPLRAGGSITLGVSILCFVLAIGLAAAYFWNFFTLLKVLNYCVPILIMILGLETALNVVLDIYRPRVKERYSRAAFDSRLLGIINEPGGILRTAASAIDYQFGFEVSQTWFYKLLEKAIIPLVLFAGVTFYLLSCFVVVAPNEQAIIEHFGNPLDKTGDKRVVGPGLTFKWPWPIDIAYRYPTQQVMELSIGFVPRVNPGQEGHGPLLWGKTHYEQEYKLLVASETQQVGDGVVPVSLVVAAVPVQYKVKDLYSYIYNHDEPEKLLESICYRELTKFAASAKIEVDDESSTNQSLLGAGRAEAKRILTQQIQQSSDQEGLGVEIVFLGLQGIHPPPEVAADYQKVVGAIQRKQAAILDAEAYRNQTLSALAGSVEQADGLYDLAARYQSAKDNSGSEQTERLGEQLDRAFTEARGDIFSKLRGAQSYAFKQETLSRADGERFTNQLKAYQAAPEIYTREQRLLALEKALKDIRKYVVVAGQNDTQVTIVDVQEKLVPSLVDFPGFKESSGK
jgi:regulator of protease activity HflC (stomatin/prohibitin superfamily)